MHHTLFIENEDYQSLKGFFVLLGKLIYSIDQSKQEAELLSRFKDVKSNNILKSIPQEDISELKPKTFKRTIHIDGCDVHVRTRKNGKRGLRFELRYRRGGLNVNASDKDRAKAIAKFTEKLKTALRAVNVPKVPDTFHEFATYYFETFRKRKVAEKTLQADLSRYKNNILPRFGSTPLRSITPGECQTLIDDILNAGHEKTAQDIFSLMNVIFKSAIAHGIIERNPLAIVIPVTHDREHGKALTKDEERKLLDVTAGTPYQLMYAVALYTGLRPNEYCTARIEGAFIIAVNSKRKTKKVEYKKIPITPMLRPYLANITELKFSSPDYLRRKFLSILPRHKLYDLRTTFYTRCQECGVADVARMEFVGHSLGKLGDTYTDLSDEFLLREGEKLIY
ncbi:MAG: site-specific integrase [Clostridia bacterium]|nr:site-specific integrase [Clostridia bacterium]